MTKTTRKAATEAQPSVPASTLAQAILVGVAAALLFVALSTWNLAAQGLYQDEVLQASGSFAYVGGPRIGVLVVGGVPLLNNSYLGAIKTGLYGVYLRLSGNGFSVISWRLFPILSVAVGL